MAKPATPKLYEETMGTVKITQTGETYTVEDAEGKTYTGLSADEAAAAAEVDVEELKAEIENTEGGVMEGIAYFEMEDEEDEEEEEDK